MYLRSVPRNLSPENRMGTRRGKAETVSTDDRVPPPSLGDDIEKWTKARLGKVTASRIGDVIAKTRNGWSAERKKYMLELISERLTGMRADVYLNQSMIWGAETEYSARMAYERATGRKTATVWFVDHPHIPQCGASPDALVGDDGLVEIKCPNTTTHIATLIEKRMPEKHAAQILWQLACTGRQWCDFISYDPRVPNYEMFVARIERNDDAIAEMEKMVIEFQAEIDKAIQSLSEIDP